LEHFSKRIGNKTMPDLDEIRQEIKTFLESNQATIQEVSKRATEVFETRSLVAVAHHYLDQGYKLRPKQKSVDDYFQFMYSPNAYPWNHSYFDVVDPSHGNRTICEIRHNQAVAGYWSSPQHDRNLVEAHTPRYQTDIAIVTPGILPDKEPNAYGQRVEACVPNFKLITLAEVKKLQPTPMLIASFQGIIYSIKPLFVVDNWFGSGNVSFFQQGKHPYPMLFTDGALSSDNVRNIVRTMLDSQKARISVVTNGMGISLREIIDQLRVET